MSPNVKGRLMAVLLILILLLLFLLVSGRGRVIRTLDSNPKIMRLKPNQRKQRTNTNTNENCITILIKTHVIFCQVMYFLYNIVYLQI